MIISRQFLIAGIFLILPSLVHAMSATFINPGKKGERFWDMVTETMQAAADDFSINLEVIYAERNRIKMTQLGQQVTSRETPPDYLILVNEEQAAEKIVLSSKEQPIKILMLLNDFLPTQRESVGYPNDKNSNLLGAVVPDNYRAGQRMMQALIQCAKNKTTSTPFHILALGGDKLTPASLDRNKGAMSAIESNSEVSLDRFLYANWNAQEAQQLTSNYLQWASRNDIQPSAIWAANDPIAKGAKTALQKANLTPGEDICLVGLNWSKEGLEMVQNGEMVLTDGGHFLAGAWSMVVIHDYETKSSAGELDKPGLINFQMQSIDQSNIGDYLDNLGDEQWSKINFSGFSLESGSGYDEYDFSLKKVLKQVQP